MVNMYWWERALIRRGLEPWEYGYDIESKTDANYLLRRGFIQLIKRPRTTGYQANDAMRWADAKYCLTRPGICFARMAGYAGYLPSRARQTSEEGLTALLGNRLPDHDVELSRQLLIVWGHDLDDMENADSMESASSWDDMIRGQ